MFRVRQWLAGPDRNDIPPVKRSREDFEHPAIWGFYYVDETDILTPRLGIHYADPEAVRIPPPSPTPSTFPPQPARSAASPEDGWNGGKDAPDLQALFSRVIRPVDLTDAHLHALNIDFAPPCSVDDLIPRAPDGSSYIPSLTSPSAQPSSYSDAVKTTDPSSQRRREFDTRLREVMLDSDTVFQSLARMVKPVNPLGRPTYLRHFWEAITAMARYWDDSLDNYIEVEETVYPDSDSQNKRQRLNTEFYIEQSIGHSEGSIDSQQSHDSEQAEDDDGDRYSPKYSSPEPEGDELASSQPQAVHAGESGPSQRTNDYIQKHRTDVTPPEDEKATLPQSEASQPSHSVHLPSADDSEQKDKINDKSQPEDEKTASPRPENSQASDPDDAQTLEGSAQSHETQTTRTSTPIPSTRLGISYKGRRWHTGREMPDQFRVDAVRGLLEAAVWPFHCTLQPPRLRPLPAVHLGNLRVPIRLTAAVHRRRAGPDTPRHAPVQGPLLGIQVRPETDFYDPQGQPVALKARLDTMREVGALLQIAQQRQRQGRTEPIAGEGKWWTTTPRWGGHRADATGTTTADAAAPVGHDRPCAPEPNQRRRHPTPLELWAQLRCNARQWDPDVQYVAVGKPPDHNVDEVSLCPPPRPVPPPPKTHPRADFPGVIAQPPRLAGAHDGARRVHRVRGHGRAAGPAAGGTALVLPARAALAVAGPV